ncbi:MAG: WD40/YVTN/BNR-like repeat-containing protein [Candidatus Limnocylindria bacterium]
MTWGGPRVEISRDLGKRWTTGANPAFPTGSPRTFSRTWHIEPGHASEPDVMWLGTEPASLFKSVDRGQTWEPVSALNDHADRKHWNPGGGGLGLHSIAVDAVDPTVMTIGISAAGVYETTDGGRSWVRANQGISSPLPQPEGDYSCVHHLVGHPVIGGARFHQNHAGTYFKDTGDKKWTNVSKGLPTDFGFASAIHPRDPKTAYGVGEAREWATPRVELRGHARGAGDGPAGSGRRVLRHDERRALGKRRRGPDVGLHRAASSADLVGRDRDALVSSFAARALRPRSAKQWAQT